MERGVQDARRLRQGVARFVFTMNCNVNYESLLRIDPLNK